MSNKVSKSWARRGLEWVATGAVLIIGSFLLPWAAPFALTLYGAYRWFLLKEPVQGASLMGVSLILWVLLMGPLSGLFWLVKVAGALCTGSGVLMLLISQKKGELPGEDDQSLIVDPKDNEKGN